MAALTASRVLSRKGTSDTGVPMRITLSLKAGTKVFKGGLVATDATGYAVSGAGLQATGLKIWGVAIKDVDNTLGASGALAVDVDRGIWVFVNLGADPVVQGDVGSPVYADDDQTVRHTSATGTRSAAGVFVGFDENGLPLVQVGNFSQTGV